MDQILAIGSCGWTVIKIMNEKRYIGTSEVDSQLNKCPFFPIHSQEEELSSSSSEEEESDQRQNEDLFGKVVCVEGVSTGDKKKSTWYPALVSACCPFH